MFTVNNKDTTTTPKTRYEICSKLTIKTPERRQLLIAGWVGSNQKLVN